MKKNGEDRHWAGGGAITIDSRAVEVYKSLTGLKELPSSKYRIQEIPDRFPVDRIHALMNRRKSDS